MTTAVAPHPHKLTPYHHFLKDAGINLTPGQKEVYDDIIKNDIRIWLLCGGEQAGKSTVGAGFLASHALFGATFWITAASYDMTNREFHYTLENLQNYEVLMNRTLINGWSWNERDKSYINLGGGIEITTKSLRDAFKVAAVAPDGILVCEADQVDWFTIERLITRVTRSQGWVGMTGTFESSLGWMAQKYAEWQGSNVLNAKSYPLPTWTNNICFPGGRQDLKLLEMEKLLPADKFMERFGGTPSPPSGLVIKEFSYKHHVVDMKTLWGEGGYCKDHPVYVWVDPGYAGAYAVECLQVIDGTVYIFDELYERLTTPDVIKLLKWKGYYKDIKSGVVDIAATQHQAMPAVAEMWAKRGEDGAGIYLASARVDLDASVDRLRAWFKIDPLTDKPRILIHHGCKGLISELGGCKPPFEDGGPWLYRKDRGGVILGYEEKNNHAISACRYGIVHHFGYTKDKLRQNYKPSSWLAKHGM